MSGNNGEKFEIYHHHVGKRFAMPTYMELLNAGYFDFFVVIAVGNLVGRMWQQATFDKKDSVFKN